MLSRYARPEMLAIWSRQEQLRLWFHIEAHAVDALVAIGHASPEIAKKLWAAEPDRFDETRIAAIEADVRHESIAFQTSILERLDADVRPYFHAGLTSSDVLDTALSVQLVRAADLLAAGLATLANSLADSARRYQHTPCMGRSHGVHAEPVTFGLKMLRAYTECQRNRDRLQAARTEVAVGKLSGSMGSYTCIDPRVEAHVCAQLGLAIEPVASQVLPRDRHGAYFAAMALVASSLERLACELRFLQITEVGEVAEGFGPFQKGSSAMPHKKNPILSENLTGLARVIRSHLLPALENVTLWQERDMSHSSVERFSAPDATITLDYALHRMIGIIDHLVVDADRMQQNLNLSRGTFASQKILLALVARGLERDVAYRIVQDAAHGMTGQDPEGGFADRLLADSRTEGRLTASEITAMVDPEPYLNSVDMIFARVLG